MWLNSAVAAHVDVIVVGAAIGQPMDQPEVDIQAVRERFVGAKDAKIALLLVELGYIVQELAKHMRVGGLCNAGGRHVTACPESQA